MDLVLSLFVESGLYLDFYLDSYCLLERPITFSVLFMVSNVNYWDILYPKPRV